MMLELTALFQTAAKLFRILRISLIVLYIQWVICVISGTGWFFYH